MKRKVKEVACCVCGCTQSRACGMGCHWVRSYPPLCSNPICQLIDALQLEADWLRIELRGARHRSPTQRRTAITGINKLIREVKSQRGELG